ncbi:MYXO-CTERM domain-containing protein [Cereibacter ovatus]|uniref:MYXO-CTERM domain-containing protein n=1 Tax=Cereibacter ovatus TaxID=439529 RepID=A0A285CSX8_9RHOB|nr:MYXO-CTERM domain-containing protein [Cereibacter ovatus]
MKTGPTDPRSTVLTQTKEATVVAFRRHTLLALDDSLYALQSQAPRLTRSAIHLFFIEIPSFILPRNFHVRVPSTMGRITGAPTNTASLTAVPFPTAGWGLVLGLAGLAALRRRASGGRPV